MADDAYWEADALKGELSASLAAGEVDRYGRWSIETFGPGERVTAVLDHISREIEEVRKAPHDIEEWADLIILAMDGAMRQGASAQQIFTTIKTKHAKNMRRVWPDWRTADPDKAIEHVRSYADEVRDRLKEGWGDLA